MSKLYYSLFIAFAFSLFFTSNLNAQDTWNLQRCIKHAQENSLDLERAELGIAFEEVNKKQAVQSRLPSLSGNTSLQWNFGKTIDPTSNEFITETFLSNNYSLSTGITLFNAGNINNTIKQSKINLTAAHEDAKQTQNIIALGVANSFLTILLAQEELDNVNFQKELSEKQLEEVDKFISAGSRPSNDRLDFVAQVAQAEQSVILAQNNLSSALLNMKQYLRLDPNYDLRIEVPNLDLIALESDPDLVNFSTTYNEALKTRPDIRAGEMRLQSAQFDQKLAESWLYPRLTFSAALGTNYSNRGIRLAGTEEVFLEETVFIDDVPVEVGRFIQINKFEDNPYTNQLDDNLSYGFGFNVSIPIYSNYSNRASVERAKLNILTTRNNNDQLKDNLKTEIQQAISDSRAAKKAYEVSNRSLEAQQAAFDNTEKKFNLGASSSFEYINSKNQLESAKINQLVSKYDYIFKLKVLDYYQGKKIQLD